MKKQITLADLRTLKPGESQMVPFDLWADYARRDNLEITGQAWDRIKHCPIVYAAPRKQEEEA